MIYFKSKGGRKLADAHSSNLGNSCFQFQRLNPIFLQWQLSRACHAMSP
jgi:hypothetical protein